MHLQPVFAGLGYREGDLPVAEEVARTALALPMHPNLSRADVTEVVGAARRALARLEAATPR
jgi:dTDP-4-amino-4,6-dideoxygalactose transaminase